jgi:hypothetical protein
LYNRDSDIPDRRHAMASNSLLLEFDSVLTRFRSSLHISTATQLGDELIGDLRDSVDYDDDDDLPLPTPALLFKTAVTTYSGPLLEYATCKRVLQGEAPRLLRLFSGSDPPIPISILSARLGQRSSQPQWSSARGRLGDGCRFIHDLGELR